MNTQVGGVIPLGNVSAGNGLNGIAVAGTSRKFITFNTFGGLLAFKGRRAQRERAAVTSTGGSNRSGRTCSPATRGTESSWRGTPPG